MTGMVTLSSGSRRMSAATSQPRIRALPRVGTEWNHERIVCELCATLLSVYSLKQQQLLRIELGLLSSMSTFRFDMSSSTLLITQEDKDAPGIALLKAVEARRLRPPAA